MLACKVVKSSQWLKLFISSAQEKEKHCKLVCRALRPTQQVLRSPEGGAHPLDSSHLRILRAEWGRRMDRLGTGITKNQGHDAT